MGRERKTLLFVLGFALWVFTEQKKTWINFCYCLFGLLDFIIFLLQLYCFFLKLLFFCNNNNNNNYCIYLYHRTNNHIMSFM